MKSSQMKATTPGEVTRENENDRATDREGREQAAFDAALARLRRVRSELAKVLGSGPREIAPASYRQEDREAADRSFSRLPAITMNQSRRNEDGTHKPRVGD